MEIKIQGVVLARLSREIQKLPKFLMDFEDVRDNEKDEVFDTYSCYRLFDKIIVHNECFSPNIERTFYVYDEHDNKLRETTEFEDEVLRTYDDEYPIMEGGEFLHFVVCKNSDNSITQGDFK